MNEAGMNVNEDRTFSDVLRIAFKGMFTPIAAFLLKIGVKPNMVTLSGLIGHIAGAALIATGNISWGGIVILLMAPVDYLDGTMARLKGEPSAFGAFVDSVTDRYSEFILYGGILLYYLSEQDWIACMFLFLAASGSYLVPYIRAKAEALGFTSKIGILSRVERYIILIPSLIFNRPMIALVIIAVLANFTALQRIWTVRQQYYASKTVILDRQEP
ncbi:MAG: CDP-alcohol phosphatidyltransferase family protein [Anaerolineae bacterium]|nr:CDP-alcohol phosphatidyltransferase family protein [Anaerolineae bacterium]